MLGAVRVACGVSVCSVVRVAVLSPRYKIECTLSIYLPSIYDYVYTVNRSAAISISSVNKTLSNKQC